MKYILLIAMGLLFWSCFNEGDCIITATNYMEIQFKKKSNHSLDSLVAFTSIRILRSDSVLIFGNVTSTIIIPVDIHRDTTTFVLNRVNVADSSNTASDTLAVSYSRQSKVISSDCGAYTFYSNLKILRKETSLDSAQIVILNRSLVKDPSSPAYAVNYQIFY